MYTPVYILLILGILGALDILLYHSISHGIRTHEHSRLELFTHSLRGPIYAALFILIPNAILHGLWYWLLMAILLVDVGVSIFDFILERKSRLHLGGLPTGEYILHILLAMLFGALVTSILYETRHWAGLPTQIAWIKEGVPAWIRLLLSVMAVFVLGSGAMDLLAAMKLQRKVVSHAT